MKRASHSLYVANRQRGVVLVVSLLMIAVLALLATASINISSSELLIVDNQQSKRASEATAESLIEDTLSELDTLKNNTALAPQARNGMTVERSAPVCTRSTPVSGFSLTNPLSLQHNYYEFEVTATDNDNGATSRFRNGTRVLLNADTC